ncbi:DUF6470 family protein [Oceanobacillus halotolerans]|uniref:DUF6470 family protein n=1 Tax=Oceanobacillus halotolerans TaxID=2663380 RepID=UPI0013DAEED1|nr:DUF6470 family protein [Oceanobacillus halotolerans]
MQFPQIRMQSQMAQIAIKQTGGVQTIRQPQAEQTIQQPKADISMKTRPSKLTIDQTKAWEDMGLMHISKRIETFANEGKQGLKEGIARKVRQGDELMKIENGGNPLARQAAENGHDGMKSLGIDFIPSHFSVKTTYEPSEVDITVNPNPPIIQATPNKPIMEYQPGSVETSMKQYPSLEIDVVVE